MKLTQPDINIATFIPFEINGLRSMFRNQCLEINVLRSMFRDQCLEINVSQNF